MEKQLIKSFFKWVSHDLYYECDSKTLKQVKRKIKSLGFTKDDQTVFIKKCQELGGYCDCEVFFNIKDKQEDEFYKLIEE